MLYRSLYFVLHDAHTVRHLISELEKQFSLNDAQLHAIIEQNHKLTELPGATLHKKSTEAIRQEKTFAYISAGGFTVALIALIISLLMAPWYLSALLGLIVVATQLSGYLLGNRMTNAQFDRFRTGMAQGDIVLQVDVPPSQSREVKAYIDERIPDAKTGVSNWHMGTIGL